MIHGISNPKVMKVQPTGYKEDILKPISKKIARPFIAMKVTVNLCVDGTITVIALGTKQVICVNMSTNYTLS